MLELARSDPLPERRMAAMMYLGETRDPDARVQEILAQTATSGEDPALRRGALASLSTYGVNHTDLSEWVNGQLLQVIRTEGEVENRYQALVGLNWSAVTPEFLTQVRSAVWGETQPDVRAIAYEAMGGIHPNVRGPTLNLLEEAFSRETEDYVRKAIVTSLAKAGRAQALPVLGRLQSSAGPVAKDVADYIEILSKDDRDWEKIEQEKSRREAGQGS
jgi:hypothetical protein